MDTEEEKHIAAIQNAIEKRGMLNHTVVHGVFVGPARSGKNSLMERLLGRMPSSVSPSTGVAESVVQVKVIQKSTTIATNVEESIWSVMDYDDEAIKLMLISSDSRIKESEDNLQKYVQNDVESQDVPLEAQHTDRCRLSLSLLQSAMRCLRYYIFGFQTAYDSVITDSEPGFEQQLPSLAKSIQSPPQLPDSFVSPIEILKQALRNKGLEALKQHFEKTWSLYLTNTGGQMEFQEVLPLLVSGPSMFFFTFRLDRDLNELYKIEFERFDGTKSDPYTSTLTTMDGILQTLASISAMGTFVYRDLQRKEAPLRPKVFFIGTHKDQLDSTLADSYIARVDQQLVKVIKSTAHYKELVEFASSSQLIFTVNNFSESDSDFQNIRSAVERVVKRDEFHMTSPAHWLIFSVAIRKLPHIINYDSCFEVANQCGISSQEEFNEALHFIHSKMGLIRYFPYEDVKDLVVIHPQHLFDKVTELIVDTFTFEKVCKQKSDEFKCKGIFSITEFDHINTASKGNTGILPFKFGKLLEYLRIAAPFEEDNETKFFFPCVLAHASEPEKNQEAYKSPIPSLLISFECGYCPKGVAGALIKYLMTNEMKSYSHWMLLTDKIFRNQVSFTVGAYDTIVIRILPTHFEITCSPDPQFNNKRGDCSIEETCTEVLKAIETGIQQILTDLQYIKIKYLPTFPCQAAGCQGGHPAKVLFSKSTPSSLVCETTGKLFKLPPGSHLWNLTPKSQQEQLQTSSKTQHTQLTEHHQSVLLKQLTKHSAKWKEIGSHLGFFSTELDGIQAKPLLLIDAPNSWLSEVLSEWLQWAPGDSRGSTSFATLEGLKAALREAGLGVTAHDLSVQY